MKKITYYISCLVLSIALTACADSEKSATPTNTCNLPEGLVSRSWKLDDITCNNYTIPDDKKEALMNAARQTLWLPDCKVMTVNRNGTTSWGTYLTSDVNPSTVVYTPNNKGVTFGNIPFSGMFTYISGSKCLLDIPYYYFSDEIGATLFQSMFGFSLSNSNSNTVITFEYINK